MALMYTTFIYICTILVLDEYREGIPVGWMITNREDTAAIRLCLLKVKKNVVILRVMMQTIFLIHGKVFSIPLTPKGLPVLRILIKAGKRD